jgi:hypothetical protein
LGERRMVESLKQQIARLKMVQENNPPPPPTLPVELQVADDSFNCDAICAMMKQEADPRSLDRIMSMGQVTLTRDEKRQPPSKSEGRSIEMDGTMLSEIRNLNIAVQSLREENKK